jgi:hypothetical protein
MSDTTVAGPDGAMMTAASQGPGALRAAHDTYSWEHQVLLFGADTRLTGRPW